jgi:hypothetical protein
VDGEFDAAADVGDKVVPVEGGELAEVVVPIVVGVGAVVVITDANDVVVGGIGELRVLVGVGLGKAVDDAATVVPVGAGTLVVATAVDVVGGGGLAVVGGGSVANGAGVGGAEGALVVDGGKVQSHGWIPNDGSDASGAVSLAPFNSQHEQITV